MCGAHARHQNADGQADRRVAASDAVQAAPGLTAPLSAIRRFLCLQVEVGKLVFQYQGVKLEATVRVPRVGQPCAGGVVRTAHRA
jgi:hypothetical protein